MINNSYEKIDYPSNLYKNYSESGSVEKENPIKNEKFLMSLSELDRIRFRPLTPEKSNYLEELNKEIQRVIGEYKPNIFEKIKEANSHGRENYDFFNDQERMITEAASLSSTLTDVPEEVLGEILKPLNQEIRQLIYVQRDKITLERALAIYRKHIKNNQLVFHVSPYDINGGLKKGKDDSVVYFSTDIKRLFNLTNPKYIYAFFLDSKSIDRSKYGALDCFGKIALRDRDEIEVVDKIKIFDEKDQGYLKRVIKELGAGFDSSYSPSDNHAAQFIKRDSSNYELSS